MKFYTLSPNVPENPVLFPMMRPTIIAEGHQFVNNISECDVVMLDLHTRIADYDEREIDEVIASGKAIASFCEWDRGGMSDIIWPWPLTIQQENIFEHCRVSGIRHVHFCRLLNKNDILAPNMYPYEKPIHYEEPLLTADELFNRPIDVTYVANSAPSREEIKKAFEADGRLKCNFVLGATKLPFNEWVDEHRKSKFFIAASGGGYSCEKKQNLFSIAALIQERTDQLLLHPFTHEENCLMISQPPTREDIDTIVDYCNDKEKLYRLYLRNYNFMKTYYSKECIAKDILYKILKHCTT